MPRNDTFWVGFWNFSDFVMVVLVFTKLTIYKVENFKSNIRELHDYYTHYKFNCTVLA